MPAVVSCIFLGAFSIDVCQPCLPGHYCAEVGLSSPSGPCNAGYYCTEGSRTASPWGNTTGNSLIIPDLYIVLINAREHARLIILEMAFAILKKNGKTVYVHHIIPLSLCFYLVCSLL